jgi:serine/threonine protein kinase
MAAAVAGWEDKEGRAASRRALHWASGDERTVRGGVEELLERKVEQAEVFCRACRTACPLLSLICPTCESAPSFSVSGNFNLKGTLRILHDGRGGGGATNTVLLGQAMNFKQKVVVKAARLDQDPVEAQNIREEVQIQRRMAHPNLVSLLYAAETSSEVIVVTPFAAGGDLHAALDNGLGILDELQSRNLCSQLLQGLSVLHEKLSVLHGDMKPRNVFLVPAGTANVAQLGDFGLTRLVPREGLRKCPFIGVQGTHGYIAPEIIAHEDHGRGVDLFALGVIMFMLMGGYEPFYPASNVHAPVEFDEMSWRHISEACKTFVLLLLRVAPEERPGTAAEAQMDPWLCLEPPAPTAKEDLPPSIAMVLKDLAFHPAEKVWEALSLDQPVD